MSTETSKDHPLGPTIVLIADGWTKPVFMDALHDGQIPEIGDLLVASGQLHENVVCNLPSVSMASHTSILTGSYQSVHGIPAHRWKDERTGIVRSYLRAAGPENVNSDISSSVRTVFESYSLLGSVSVQGVVRRGATESIHLPTMRSEPILRKVGEKILRNDLGLAVGWLPRVDVLSHIHGPSSPQVRAEMVETSRSIGALAERLDHAGMWESTQLVMVPDHGHRSVSGRTSLKDVLARAGVSARINPRSSRSGSPLALTSGDSAAYLYLESISDTDSEKVAATIANQPEVELVCRFDGRQWNFHRREMTSTCTLDGDSRVVYRSGGRGDPLGLVTDSDDHTFDLESPTVSNGKYPDIIHQVIHSYVKGRSAKILIFASKGTHFGTGPRMGWRFGFHRGSHGGPFAEEVVVAAVSRGARRSVGATVRSADLLGKLGILDSALMTPRGS